MVRNKFNCVVLVDDDIIECETNRRLLFSTGKVDDIKEFTYAEEALEFLCTPQAEVVDLILLDLNMPRMDGFEFLESFRERRHSITGQPLIVVLTTSDSSKDMTRSHLYDEICQYFQKPLSMEAFAHLLSPNPCV